MRSPITRPAAGTLSTPSRSASVPRATAPATRSKAVSPAGVRVVVVEDSVTSGGSLLAALEVIEEHGAVVAGVLALVDRREGGAERLAEAGYDFRAVFRATDLL